MFSAFQGTTWAAPPRCRRAHAMTPFTPRCHRCQHILWLPEDDGRRMNIDHVEVLTTVWASYYTIHKVYKLFQSTLCFPLIKISIVVLSCDLNPCLEFISFNFIPLSMRFPNEVSSCLSVVCRLCKGFLIGILWLDTQGPHDVCWDGLLLQWLCEECHTDIQHWEALGVPQWWKQGQWWFRDYM
jgi:hypothetical protein